MLKISSRAQRLAHTLLLLGLACLLLYTALPRLRAEAQLFGYGQLRKELLRGDPIRKEVMVRYYNDLIAAYDISPTTDISRLRAIAALRLSVEYNYMNWNAAEEELKKSLAATPLDAPMWVRLAYLALHQGRMKDAAGHLIAALNAAPYRTDQLENIVGLAPRLWRFFSLQEKVQFDAYLEQWTLNKYNHIVNAAVETQQSVWLIERLGHIFEKIPEEVIRYEKNRRTWWERQQERLRASQGPGS